MYRHNKVGSASLRIWEGGASGTMVSIGVADCGANSFLSLPPLLLMVAMLMLEPPFLPVPLALTALLRLPLLSLLPLLLPPVSLVLPDMISTMELLKATQSKA